MQPRKPIWREPNWASRFLDYWITPVREYLRRRHLLFNLLQLTGTIAAIYWWRHLPVPGYAIGVLAVLAAAMSVHGDMRQGHKVIWMLLIGAFLVIEFRAIDSDRTTFVREEACRRKEENEKFQAIAEGINRSIQQAQNNFNSIASGLQASIESSRQAAINTATHADIQFLNDRMGVVAFSLPIRVGGSVTLNVFYENQGSEAAKRPVLIG